jgi:hypothetical protein
LREPAGHRRPRPQDKPLEEALLAIAIELCGRAGVRLALKLSIVAARDALLRRIKAAPLPGVEKVRVLGVDNFAFKHPFVWGRRRHAARKPGVAGPPGVVMPSPC